MRDKEGKKIKNQQYVRNLDLTRETKEWEARPKSTKKKEARELEWKKAWRETDQKVLVKNECLKSNGDKRPNTNRT